MLLASTQHIPWAQPRTPTHAHTLSLSESPTGGSGSGSSHGAALADPHRSLDPSPILSDTVSPDVSNPVVSPARATDAQVTPSSKLQPAAGSHPPPVPTLHARRDSTSSMQNGLSALSCTGIATPEQPSVRRLISSATDASSCSGGSSSIGPSGDGDVDGSSISSTSVSPPAPSATAETDPLPLMVHRPYGSTRAAQQPSLGKSSARAEQPLDNLQPPQHFDASSMQQHVLPSPYAFAPSQPMQQTHSQSALPASHQSTPQQHTHTIPTPTSAQPTHSTTAATPPMHVTPGKRGQGFSCHHCKTHKMPESLLFCSNMSKKGPGKKRCRKKYCDSCLKRLYGHPADVPLQDLAAGFQCPACLGSCVCAGCERKSMPAAATGAGGIEESPSSEVSPSHTEMPPSHRVSARTPSPCPVSLPPSHGGPKPLHLQQTKPTTPLGKPASKKRRTSIDSGITTDDEAAEIMAGQVHAMPSSNVASPSLMRPLPLSHLRAHSGELPIPTHFHLPPASSLPFSSITSTGINGCPRQESTGSNMSLSPRVAALSAAIASPSAGSRMIHLPPCALTPPTPLLGSASALLSSSTGSSSHGAPLPFGMGASLFASHVQQQVQIAREHAAAASSLHSSSSAMDTSLPDLHLPPLHSLFQSPSLNSSSMAGSSSSSIMGQLSTHTSPFSTPKSLPRRASMVAAGMDAPGSSESSSMMGDIATSQSSSVMPSPVISPSTYRRLDASASSGSASSSSTSAAPTDGAAETELMSVLASVACSATNGVSVISPSSASPLHSAALPPAHPPRTDAPSPKLAGFGSMSLLSPSHQSSGSSVLAAMSQPVTTAANLLTPVSAHSNPLSSLTAMQSALRSQHALELQCLRELQQSQMAELERMAIREMEGAHQQQTLMLLQSQRAQMSATNGAATGAADIKMEAAPPNQIKSEIPNTTTVM